MKSCALHRQDLGQRRAPARLVRRRESSRAPRRCDRHRRTCARCGTGRCPPRRTRAPARASAACRHWRGPACAASRRPIPSASAKSPDSSGLMVGTCAPHHLAGRAVDGDDVALLEDLPLRRERDRRPESTRMPPAPETHGLPMPRATTAACEVMPPRVVRMPSAACMPWMSSGLVSTRTRMTCAALRLRLLGLVGIEDDLARGGARRRRQPVRDDCRAALRDRASDGAAGRAKPDRCAPTASSRLISPSSAMSTAILSAALRRALAGPGLQHPQPAVLDGEFEILHVAVMAFEPIEDRLELARTSPASAARARAHPTAPRSAPPR